MTDTKIGTPHWNRMTYGPQHGGWKRMIELEGKARVHAHQVNQDQIRNAVHSGDIDLAADLSRNAGGEA